MAREQAGTQGNIQADTAATTAREAADTKETKMVPAQEQLIQANQELRAAQASGNPEAIKAAQGKVADITASFNAKEAPEKPGTPEQQLVIANEDLRKAQASGDAAAVKAAQDKVSDITSAINAKTGAAATPASPEQVTEYGNRVAALNLTPEQFKTYGTAPPGTTVAELDKRYAEAQGLKGISDKEAETKVTNQARDDAAAAKKVEQTGKVYDNYSKQVDKVKDPVDAIGARAGLAIKNLDLKDKAADALVAPEILTLAAGGQGSGLRMNEAEIQRIVGGRDVWDTLKSKINYLRTKGGTFDDVQRAQLKQIATYIADRSSAISSVLDVTRENMLAGQSDESAVRKSYNDGKKVVSNIEEKGIVPAGGKLKAGDYVYHEGQVLKVGSDGKTGEPVL
jgi:hypothetical protein